MPVNETPPERYESLDGLRGLAALSVCLYHFFCAYVPNLIPGEGGLAWWISYTPLAILYNGAFAVTVFFVLSGFVVSNSAAKRHMPIMFNLIQRYFRLAIPVLGGTLFGWALLASFPQSVTDLKGAGNHPWLQWAYDGREPGFFVAVQDALIGIFIHGRSQFNNVLWTMKIELIGSLGIYLLYGLVAPRFRMWVLTTLGFLCAFVLKKPEYSAFALGALLLEARFGDYLSSRWAWPALLYGIIFGSMMPGFDHRFGLPRLSGIFTFGGPQQFWQILAAVALLYAVMASPVLKSILIGKPAQFLGEISFGLYLVHVPMLYTIFVPMFLIVKGSLVGMIALLTLFLSGSLIVGYVFTLLIDKPTVSLIRSTQRAISSRGYGVPGAAKKQD